MKYNELLNLEETLVRYKDSQPLAGNGDAIIDWMLRLLREDMSWRQGIEPGEKAG